MNKYLPQDLYDENRKRFDAETTIADLKMQKCNHDGNLRRLNANEVMCTKCGAGWFENGVWEIKDGRLTS